LADGSGRRSAAGRIAGALFLGEGQLRATTPALEKAKKMRDWQKLVRDRLYQLELEDEDKEEIWAELAAHLEDDYLSSLGQGISERAAIRGALQSVNDWRDLKARIELARKKESFMNKRVSQFWFPAFLTLFLTMTLLMVIQEIGPKPWVSVAWNKSPRIIPVLVVYLSWLITLPFIGALGAYLSSRAGGRARTVCAAVIFPIVPYLAFFAIGLPIAVILDDHVAHNIMISAFFVGLAGWVILPGIALLVGGLPVRYFSGQAAASPASEPSTR
jgi:hypothetical protein